MMNQTSDSVPDIRVAVVGNVDARQEHHIRSTYQRTA